MKKQVVTARILKSLITLFCCFTFISTFSQGKKFNFGIQTSASFSQIEGDNLIGFNKLGYGFGLLGGYNFTEDSEFIFSGQYERFGSNRSGAKASKQVFRPLAEVELQVISVYMAYSKKFGDSWEGDHKFRYAMGLKLNNVLNQRSNIYTADIDDNPEFVDDDFRNRYISLKFSVGLIIKGNTVLDLIYDHALQNIIARENNFSISKLVPFHLGLNLSYYLK